MKKFLALLMSIIILHTSASASFAQEVIIPGDHYPPWRVIQEGDSYAGINAEITEYLLKKVDLKAKYIYRPWKRCLSMMKNGSADLLPGLLKNEERASYMTFLDPPYKTKSTKAFYVLKGNSGTIKSYQDLTGKTIGVTLGSKFFPKFDNDTSLKKDFTQSEDKNFKKLLGNRVDAIIVTETVGDYLVHKHGYLDKIEKAEYKYDLPLSVYFAVSKKSSLVERVPELEAALSEMVESGQVQQIIDHFLDETPVAE